MTDDLKPLQDGLRTAPATDPAAREAAIALAMKNFDALQGSPTPPRPNSVSHRKAGVWSGVRNMLKNLSNRGVLAAASSVAALAVAVIAITPGLRDAPIPPPVVLQAPPMDAAAPAPKTAEVATEAELAAPLSAAKPLARQTGVVAPDMAAAPATRLALPGTERFGNAPANPVQITTEAPVSTLSVDVDTASYAIIRNHLLQGQRPPAEAVRVEEIVNYFPYAYPAPEPGAAPFQSTVTVMPTPWNSGTKLVHIGLQGRLPALAERPALNLVFLIDTSGSMEDHAKLPLLKQSFRMLIGQLRAEDEVAIVAYAGSAGTILSPTTADRSADILAALDRLSTGGPTDGSQGLELAYTLAQGMGRTNEVSRVILATDGDFNLGISDPEALKTLIAKQRDSGIYLSVLGFGRSNLDDATMQALAQNGNGTAAYIDTAQEARKVLVDQLTGALFPIANDVKIQVEWNPAAVAEYRLIGYETRALTREDFNNDQVDAGEIGAGHSVTAIYEVTAPDSPALRNDPLRYTKVKGDATELGFLRLRYKAPGEEVSALIETPILPDASASPNEDARFAVAMAGFGQLLTASTYLGDWGWDQAIALAEGARGADPYGYRVEAVNLMRLAQGMGRP